MSSKIKVLVLPFVVGMSDAEAKQIRAFAEGGGVVVADYRCGVRDEHGKLRKTGVLDDLFGIRRVDLEVTRRPQTVVFNTTDSGRGGQMRSTFHDRIVAEDATPWGNHDDGAPALIARFDSGALRTAYLNFDLYAYEQMRREGDEHDVREAFRMLLMNPWLTAVPHVQARFVPEHEHGHPIGGLRVTRFRDAGAHYYGVLPDYYIYDKAPVIAALPFPADTHVYNVRGQRYLGPSGVIHDRIERGRAAMYAALPYKVGGVKLACTTKAVRNEPIHVEIKVTSINAKRGPHAVRVEVVHPDTTAPEYWPRTLYLPEGRGTFIFTTALNAPTGMWRVRATESVSGMTVEVGVKIK